MSILTDCFRRNLPLRISFWIGSAISLLLIVSLAVMLLYSRKNIKEDALTRASYSLEQAMTGIDNILLSVEETTGNTCFNFHLAKPELRDSFCQKMKDTNPYIINSIIALKGDGSRYEHEAWFAQTVDSARAGWLRVEEGQSPDSVRFISYCMPVRTPKGKVVGAVRSDVSLSVLSSAVAAAKPSPNSYCALLDKDGTFIVHPLADYLFDFSAFNIGDESLNYAAKAMVSGATGYVPFEIDGNRFLLFYKPFEYAAVPYRDLRKNGWSIGVAYAEEDIFGDYNSLFNFVLLIAVVGILLIYLYITLIVRHKLRPLRLLTNLTQRIADGHYNEPVPKSRKRDEIGQLQRYFRRMQTSIAVNMRELKELTETIKERNEELQVAYRQAKKADRMKTAFLHNMTNQMVDPAFAIESDVIAMCEGGSDKRIGQLAEHIQQNGDTITRLLNNMIELSEQEMNQEKGGES